MADNKTTPTWEGQKPNWAATSRSISSAGMWNDQGDGKMIEMTKETGR